MAQGYQIWCYWLNLWWCTLMRQSCWCTDPADVPTLMMRRSCWCADPADAPILLMRRSCWFAYSADALILLMRWFCWLTDAADALMLLMCLSCWCYWIRINISWQRFLKHSAPVSSPPLCSRHMEIGDRHLCAPSQASSHGASCNHADKKLGQQNHFVLHHSSNWNFVV